MKLLHWVLDRLDERSTWAALGVILGLFGVNVESEVWSLVAQSGAAFAAALMAVLPDGPIPGIEKLKEKTRRWVDPHDMT